MDASEIPPIRTEFIEELGQGAFGKVNKSKLTDGLDYFPGRKGLDKSKQKVQFVAVKELHGECHCFFGVFVAVRLSHFAS